MMTNGTDLPDSYKQNMDSLFEEGDQFAAKLPADDRDRIKQNLSQSGMPRLLQSRIAVTSFLSDRTNKPVQEISDHLGFYQDAYAKQVFKMDHVDTETFKSFAKGQLKKEKNENMMLNEMAHGIADQFTKTTNFSDAYAAQQKMIEGHDGYDPEHVDKYQQFATDVWKKYQDHAQKYGTVIDPLKRYFDLARNGVAPNKEAEAQAAYEQAITSLKDIPKEDRPFVMSVASRGSQPQQKGFEQKIAERLERGIGQLGVDAAEGFGQLSRLFAPIAMPEALDPKSDISKAYTEQDKENDIKNEIQDVLTGKVDPAKSSNFIGEAVLKSADMLPRIAALSNAGGIALAYSASTGANSRRLREAGMDSDKAALIGAAAAVPDTALQFVSRNFIEGKIPGLNNLLTNIGSTSGRLAANFAVEVGALGAITTAQQLVEPTFQWAASKFDSNIKGIDWSDEFKKIKDAAPETAVMMLPFILLGTGAASFRDPAYGRELLKNTDALKGLGITDDTIAKMSAAKSVSEQVSILQKNYPKFKDIGDVSGFIKDLNSKMEDLKSPDAPLQKVKITATGDGRFNVFKPTGELVGTADSHEMAFKLAEDTVSNLPSDKAAEDLKKIGTPEKESFLDRLKKGDQRLGITQFPAISKFITEVADSVANAWNFSRAIPKLEGFKKIINEWTGSRQIASMKMEGFLKEIKRLASDKVVREGIANWIDAGGDHAELNKRLSATNKASLKRGYEAALKLTPEQLQLAQTIKRFFDDEFERGNKAGILKDEQFRENYVTQLIERPYVGGGVGSKFFGKLSTVFQYSKERTFPNFGELEAADFNVKTKDIGEIIGAYSNSLTKAIETRKMIEALKNEVNDQGQKLAYTGKIPDEETGSYQTIDHPSLRGVKLHEDIASHLRNILGKSAIREWYDQPGSPIAKLGKGAAKFIDTANKTLGNTMLSGLSTFHVVHEAKRAAGNLVNIFNLKEISYDDPMVQRAVKSSLMIYGDHDATAMFQEGLGGGRSLTDKIPGLREINKVVSEWTFKEVIPKLKYSTWLALRERNLNLLKDEISRGEVTVADAEYLAAKQVNARFGELNYADMGRNPTMQHLYSFAALAPDFFESNLRNYGQVGAGLTGAKVGREPLKAFLVTAVGMYVTARVLNKAADDDYHWEEPFGVIHDGKSYTMRNEAEDLWRAIKSTRRYISGRTSPIVGTAVDMFTGRNYRGEAETVTENLRDFAAKVIPLSFRWLPGVKTLNDYISPTQKAREVSIFDQFLSSQGLQVGRVSDISEAYKIKKEWNDSLPEGDPLKKKDDTGVYPVSPYQQIRYGLEDKNDDKVLTEINKIGPKNSDEVKKLERSLQASLTHLWTGSAKGDAAFIASLNAKDQYKVLKAQFMREAMYGKFLFLLDKYAKDHNIEYQSKEYVPSPSRDIYNKFRENGQIKVPNKP